MKVRTVIDRFEGDRAVLLLGDDERQVVWHRTFLPGDAREGDVLTLEIMIDAEATRLAREEAEELLRSLSGDK